MHYNEYRFLYPPRSEVKIRPSLISQYDTNEYIGQVKYNGSACTVYLHYGAFVKVMNRHGEHKTRVDNSIRFEDIKTEGWTVLAGELLDKSKKGEDGNTLTGFVIWDILCYENQYLVGFTLSERLELMERLWPCQRMQVTDKGLVEYKHLCYTGIQGVYKTPSYLGGSGYFSELYNELITTECYEGLVLKKANAKLELGFGEKNNSGWQIKVRKATKNAKF